MKDDGRKSDAVRQRSAERMRKLHADPEFAQRHAQRSAERMRKLNADPERKAALRRKFDTTIMMRLLPDEG